MVKKVFISYRSSDRLAAQALITAIEQSGAYDIWYDQNLSGGQKWWDEIMRHLREADVVVLALSNDYLASYPCKLERDYAHQLHKAIVPVRIDSNLKDADLEYNLAVSQYVRYDAYTQDKTRLKEALEAAQSGQPPYPLPEPPQTPVPQLLKIKQDLAQKTLTYDQQKEILEQLRWHGKENPQEQAEVGTLLNRLMTRPDVSANIHKEAEQILQTLASVRPHTSEPPNNRMMMPIVGIVLLVAFIIAAVAFVLANSDDANNTPTATADTSATSSPTNNQTTVSGETGAFDLTLIYGEQDSFTIKLNQASHLYGITLEANDTIETIADSFPELGVLGFVGQADTCLRYVRTGTTPPLPRACNAENTFIVTLSGSDVFWYNDTQNQYANVALKRNGEVLRLCSHGNGSGSCDVSGL